MASERIATSPHYGSSGCGGPDEYRFTGRINPGRPLGMDRHGARTSVMKLMPIVLVRRDESGGCCSRMQTSGTARMVPAP